MTYFGRSISVVADGPGRVRGLMGLSSTHPGWPARLSAGVDAVSIFLGLTLTAPALSYLSSHGAFAALQVFPPVAPSHSPAAAFGLSAVLALVAALCFAIDGQHRHLNAARERRTATGLILFGLVAAHLLLADTLGATAPAGTIVIGWAGAWAVLIVSRHASRRLLAGNIGWCQPTVIVGPTETSRELAGAIDCRPGSNLRVTHILSTDGVCEDKANLGAKSSGRPAQSHREIAAGENIATDLMEQFGNHAVVVCPPKDQSEISTQRLLFLASSVNGRAGIADPERKTVSIPTDGPAGNSDGIELHWVENRLGNPYWRAFKRGFDILASALILVLLAPLFVMIALPGLLRRESVIYGHCRVGRYGRPFTCFKFRTMVSGSDLVLERLLATDSEARREWNHSFKLRNDPRITPLGAVLRRTSLDELPQLWNVLKGDMSLVGPRPVIESEMAYYGDEAVCYYSVRPGLTGLWQVSGRNDTTYEQRVALDISYIRGWSVWKDIVILFKTFFVVLYGTGAY